jgi:(R)-2-hydroxyacyl-CoA dehydratese activating ATPase
MICAGIDSGSRAIKVVIFDSAKHQVIAKSAADQGVEQDAIAGNLFKQLLSEIDIARSRVKRIVATGYGRNIINFADTTITEITCHAVGARFLAPDAMTVIDIGGQDSKLIRLAEMGQVRDFAMNDRCAAGTGRFLEVMAHRLGVELEDLGKLARKSSNPAIISSMCVVFAETEIIGLLASGSNREDIVAGVQASIASRIAGMSGRNLTQPIYFTGGAALVPGMKEALSKALNQEVRVVTDPQMTGALGAAILGGSAS